MNCALIRTFSRYVGVFSNVVTVFPDENLGLGQRRIVRFHWGIQNFIPSIFRSVNKYSMYLYYVLLSLVILPPEFLHGDRSNGIA